jgi:hypothetical protein
MKIVSPTKLVLLALISFVFISCTDNSTITTGQNNTDFNMTLQGPDDSLIWVENELKFEIIQDSFGLAFPDYHHRNLERSIVPTLFLAANLYNPSEDTISFTQYTCSWTNSFATKESSDFYICQNICYSNGWGIQKIVPSDTLTYLIQVQKNDSDLVIGDSMEVSFTFSESIKKHESPSAPTTVWSNEIVVRK